MKKSNNNTNTNNNNRYRNNNHNNHNYNNSGAIYSLNYKFDSSSIAGKCSGTALDLIKRYNDLAKDAQSNSDYVNAEIFRQYAEHYRKIVTDINERRNYRSEQESAAIKQEEQVAQNQAPQQEPVAEIKVEQPQVSVDTNEEVKPRVRKAFKIIEISQMKTKADEAPQAEMQKNDDKPKRTYRRKTVG